jgi:hypothetical protein
MELQDVQGNNPTLQRLTPEGLQESGYSQRCIGKRSAGQPFRFRRRSFLFSFPPFVSHFVLPSHFKRHGQQPKRQGRKVKRKMHEKGLRARSGLTCTLSQNGYGESHRLNSASLLFCRCAQEATKRPQPNRKIKSTPGEGRGRRQRIKKEELKVKSGR